MSSVIQLQTLGFKSKSFATEAQRTQRFLYKHMNSAACHSELVEESCALRHQILRLRSG